MFVRPSKQVLEFNLVKKLISIVVPAYNEAANLDELFNRLKSVFDELQKYDFEVIIVENGSSDASWEILERLNKLDNRFKSIQLSRNFTAPGGITAGFKYAKGDAVIMMCADLQDPPEKIHLFLEKWEEGFDIVYHLVSQRKGIRWTRALASEMYHWLMDKLTDGAMPRNASVFRLMDKKAYEAFNSLNETNRYFTGLCSWIGFNSVGIEFPRNERFAGEAKSPFGVVLRLALNGIFSFSYAPLKMISYVGSAISISSLIYFLALVVDVLLNGRKTVAGIATEIAMISFFFGVLFLFLGIIGEYLARIYDEVKGRPNFIVKNQFGLPQSLNSKKLKGVYSDGKIILDQPIENLEELSTIQIDLRL